MQDGKADQVSVQPAYRRQLPAAPTNNIIYTCKTTRGINQTFYVQTVISDTSCLCRVQINFITFPRTSSVFAMEMTDKVITRWPSQALFPHQPRLSMVYWPARICESTLLKNKNRSTERRSVNCKFQARLLSFRINCQLAINME